MTDTEKVKLISRIISDFWEFNDQEEAKNNAAAMVTAIGSVVDFGEDNHAEMQ